MNTQKSRATAQALFEKVENLERTTFETVFQAISDYSEQSVDIFRHEIDAPGDIAEDVTREAIESMGVSGFRERLYGKVDYKKAMYVFVPEPHPVALMLDAKAEKGNGSATIQMSQTSMRVLYHSKNGVVSESGKLKQNIQQGGRNLHVVSIIAKYVYQDAPVGYDLKKIIVACIPNGALQNFYNPTPEDTIWRAGRHAPTRDEDFRVRLNYNLLKKKMGWRVKYLEF